MDSGDANCPALAVHVSLAIVTQRAYVFRQLRPPATSFVGGLSCVSFGGQTGSVLVELLSAFTLRLCGEVSMPRFTAEPR
jgi:uncharacterized protein (DUF2342 family)